MMLSDLQLRPPLSMDINKDLMAASSAPIVMAILASGDSYGYAIIQRVRELSAGRMEWTDGMLYPLLHRLERLGYVKTRWAIAESGRKRKYYHLTAQGRAQLEWPQTPSPRAPRPARSDDQESDPAGSDAHVER